MTHQLLCGTSRSLAFTVPPPVVRQEFSNESFRKLGLRHVVLVLSLFIS